MKQENFPIKIQNVPSGLGQTKVTVGQQKYFSNQLSSEKITDKSNSGSDQN